MGYNMDMNEYIIIMASVQISPAAIWGFDDVQSQLAKLKKTCTIFNRIVMEVMKEICVPK